MNRPWGRVAEAGAVRPAAVDMLPAAGWDVGNGVRRCCLLSVVLLAVLLSGCAGLRQPVDRARRPAVWRSFQALALLDDRCASFEADVSGSAPRLLGRQVFSGFVVGREPAFLQFVVLSPMGQPLAMFSTNGRTFQYVDTGHRRAWAGSLATGKISRYLPEGLDTTVLYRLFAGRPVVCTPERAEIFVTGEPDVYEISCRPAGSPVVHEYLYDMGRGVIRQYRQKAGDGRLLPRATYDDFTDSSCRLPGRLTVDNGGRRFDLAMSGFLVGEHYSEAEFRLPVPPGFQKEVIQ